MKNSMSVLPTLSAARSVLFLPSAMGIVRREDDDIAVVTVDDPLSDVFSLRSPLVIS